MRTPITYYRGKQRLAERILQMMPGHRIYCEPFFGGGAVFFAKPKSYLEVINDKNDRLITFYKQIQNHFEELQEKVINSLHSEADYCRAKDIYFGRIEATDLEIAWSVWIVTNFSFSGSPIGGWKWCNGSAGSHTGVFMRRKRDEFTEALKTRLQDVQISCRDAITVIKQRDTENTFFYLDPPYPNCDQKHYRGYTTDDLEELLITLQDIKGKFILSNYNSAMLDAYIDANGWNKLEIDMPLSVANLTRSKRKTEVLVTNYINESNLLIPLWYNR